MSQVRYQIQLDDFRSHMVRVTMELTPTTAEPCRLSLPAWIPGSYMIRDFSRNLTLPQASDVSGVLQVECLDKQTFLVHHQQQPLQVQYQVYAYDLSVRANYFNDVVAVLNPAACCLEWSQGSDVVVDILVANELNHWQVATGLRRAAGTGIGQFGRYLARDYAELVDRPLLIGELQLSQFELDGVVHYVALAGAVGADVPRFTADLATICQRQRAVFGELPADLDEYWFLTWIVDKGYGGLEHRNSTLLLCNRFDLPNPQRPDETADAYVTLLGLCSHEYFHTWWVKRARPKEFLTYQLAQEQYTDQLWLYEGFTSYFDDLALVRAGLISQNQYFSLLAESMTRVERAASQTVQSLRQASWTAWTKYYKQDENARNSVTNYYARGALVAFCLEAQLQQRGLSLTGFMQRCWQQFGRPETGSDWSTLQQLLLQYTGDDVLSELLWQWIDCPGYLPLADAAQQLGLTLTRRPARHPQDFTGPFEFTQSPCEFGAWYEWKADGMHIQSVGLDTAAHQAGLMAGDLIIACDGLKATESNWRELLSRKATTEPFQLHLFRQQRLVQTELLAKPAPEDVVMLAPEESQAEATNSWLQMQSL